MRVFALTLIMLMLPGCALLADKPAQEEGVQTNVPAVVVPEDICIVDASVEAFPERCELSYWVGLWIQADNTPWPERKQRLTELGNSVPDKLRKVVLTLPVNTPYQDRLRAQHWLKELDLVMTPAAQTLIHTLVVAPNDQLLELESAITILSRMNTQQAQSMDALKADLATQRKKLEELLQIEATLMDKNRSN